ncbi:MAG: carboxypeptidase-like regulatory domain-containing protein [Armatimonadota bacterium]
MRYSLLLILALLALALGGCGGSGGGTNHTGDQSGSAQGRLAAPNASDYSLSVDGQTLDQKPDAQGNFTIPSLPPGNHSLAIVGGGGFSGAHVGFVVEPGGTADLGDIVAQPGGQIVGIVSKRDEAGNLTALEGVEVIADPQPIYYYMNGQPTTAKASRDADSLQLRAVTDANGSYVIPAVPTGSYVVTVNVPGLVQGVVWTYVSPAATAPADFQLLEAIEAGVGVVTGTILGVNANSERAPLEGATVCLTTDGTWTPEQPTDPVPLPVEALTKALVPSQATGCMPPLYDFNQFTTLTDAQGQYKISVPSGHLTLSVWSEGYNGAWDSFSLKPDQALTRDYKLEAWSQEEPPAPGTGVEPQAKKKH